MRAPRWASFWAILAAVAGLVGVGAAVYQLLQSDQSDQHAAHLMFPPYLTSPPYALWVVTLSDSIMLTGRWYIARGSWWNARTLRTGSAVGVFEHIGFRATELRTLKDVRVGMNEQKYVAIQDRAIEEWFGGSLAVCNPGEFELGIEYKWKGGTSWARTTLPLCLTR